MHYKPENRLRSFPALNLPERRNLLALRLIVSALFAFALTSSRAQELKLQDGVCISIDGIDCLAPAWSPDGKQVVFQAKNEGHGELYCYFPDSARVDRLLSSRFSLSNPLWHPNGGQIVFDSDSLGYPALFVYSLSEKTISRLIYRDVVATEASFASSGRQVYFSGLDEISGIWQIFSYDFVYDNLNQLTENESDSRHPEVAPDGKKIMYYKSPSPFLPEKYQLINWYGETQTEFLIRGGAHVCWEPQGLKVYFIQDGENGKNQLFSMWTDGSHLEQLTSEDLNFSHPTLSPDGKHIILTAEEEGHSKLYIWRMPE